MIIDLPPPRTFGAAITAGLAAADAVLVGCVVVRAAFDLVADGSNPRRPVQSSTANRYALLTQDQPAPASPGFDLLRESDFAVEKGPVDVVVECFVSGATGGVIRVAGANWYGRDATLPTDFAYNDTKRNLFGWQAKSETGRSLTDDTFVHTPQHPFPPGYTASFNNVYRRSPGFHATGQVAELSPGALVEIFRNAGGTGAADYAFTLPGLALTARLRSACDDCPDLPDRWQNGAWFPLRLDTVVVAPDNHELTLVWRASWPWGAVEPGKLRAVQILSEGT